MLEGLLFSAKLMLLLALIGFWFTAGMWCFCKIMGWAPINVTVNTTVHEDRWPPQLCPKRTRR